MKGFAFVLLCVVAAVQGRSAGVKSTGTLAALGENPWLVHLRVAVSTSGFLESCVGTIIDERWVLTSASCVRDARFIWVRYGVVDVFRPTLITETTNVFPHPEDDIALIRLNRNVITPPYVGQAPVALAETEIPTTGTFCGFGATETGEAGQELSCSEVSVSAGENGLITASEGQEATKYDLGAPLINDGVLQGLLIQETNGNGEAAFLNVRDYRGWIEATADITLYSNAFSVPGAYELLGLNLGLMAIAKPMVV